MQKLIGISYFERNNVTDFISIIMSLQVIIKVRRRRRRPFEVAKSEIDILRKSLHQIQAFSRKNELSSNDNIKLKKYKRRL